MQFHKTIRNGTIVTAEETRTGDIGIVDGRIEAVADRLPAGLEDVDATGLLVMPGGIDSHCHVEQISSNGMMTADDFHSATVSAAFGGTTTIVPFAAQHRGMSLPKVVAAEPVLPAERTASARPSDGCNRWRCIPVPSSRKRRSSRLAR